MQFPIGLPGQLVPPTLPCRHVFAQVLQLNFMQKKALFPLHLVVLSDPSHFFFSKIEKPFQWKELETHNWSLTPSASGCGDVSPVPKGPVRLGAATPIKQGEAFTSTTALSGSSWHSQDPWGQLKTPQVVTPRPRTHDTRWGCVSLPGSSQLALRNPTCKCHGLMVTPWAREGKPPREQGELILVFRDQASKYPFVEPSTASLETGTAGTSGTNRNN